ncbi:MAG: aromatic acid exporter family protein [Arcobacteraceae bacterium]
MSSEQKTPILFGARTIKTGIAVTISLFLSQYVPYSLPLLAGVAAVICMQPSITAGIQKGIVRIKATIVGGLTGLLLYYMFGNNLLVIGASVIIILWICRHLKWEEGIPLAALTVIAAMLQVSGEVLPYTAGRVISTLIGIIVATLINIVVVPPRHHITFRQEMRDLTDSFPGLYLKAVEAYAQNRPDYARQIKDNLNEIKDGIESLRQELNHLKVGTQTPLGTYFEGIELKDYVLFNQGVHFLEDIVAKLQDLIIIVQKCDEKRQSLQEEDVDSDKCYSSAEFADLMSTLQRLARMLGRLHACVFQLVGEQEIALMPQIIEQSEEIYKLKELTRQRLKNWEAEYINKMDIFLLMSTHRVIFDLEEITGDLTSFAKDAVRAATKNEKEMRK